MSKVDWNAEKIEVASKLSLKQLSQIIGDLSADEQFELIAELIAQSNQAMIDRVKKWIDEP